MSLTERHFTETDLVFQEPRPNALRAKGVMMSHLSRPRRFTLIAVWIWVLMPIRSAAYGQLEYKLTASDAAARNVQNQLEFPSGIATDG